MSYFILSHDENGIKKMLKVDCEYDRLIIFKVDFNHVHALVKKAQSILIKFFLSFTCQLLIIFDCLKYIFSKNPFFWSVW